MRHWECLARQDIIGVGHLPLPQPFFLDILPMARNTKQPGNQFAANRGEGDRLQKVLAAAGIASRRECEKLILEGRVEVDGETVTEMGTRVDRHSQQINVDGEPLPRTKLVYYAVHKPPGVVCTANDPSGRPRVTDLLPPGLGRLFTVGRLDMSSEGLILVTNDGAVANQLTHPRHGVEKTYQVQVAGHMNYQALAQAQRGVHLAEGFVQASNIRIKSKRKNSTLLEMVLDEGRNREIRRLLARVGHKVQRLIRVAVGPIRLSDMPSGEFRRLTSDEVTKLRSAAKTPSKRPPKSRQATLANRQRKRSAVAGKKTAAGRPSATSRKNPGHAQRGRRGTSK